MKRRFLFSLLALATVALLWAPMPTGVEMSFSGPVRADRSFGVLTYLHIVTEYEPSRISYAIQDEKGAIHRSERPTGPLAIGQFPRLTPETRNQDFIWEDSEGSVTFIRPKDEAMTLKPVGLGLAIVLTVLILGWLASQWLRPKRVDPA